MLEGSQRANPTSRHGGDLAGMQSKLDYIHGMGFTMIWPTPVLENNQPSYSYHGYSLTDYYKIDPRFGTNEDFRKFVAAANARGLGVIHDVVVTLGILSFFQITFDLTVLAAVLAIIGYSLNDTIVVFDRVRENFRVLRKASLIENINISTTQTLLRTVATSVSTLLAIAALLFFGGDNLFGFSLALFIGVMAGTYSSIYIANVVLIWLNLSSEDLIPPVKTEGVDDRP